MGEIISCQQSDEKEPSAGVETDGAGEDRTARGVPHSPKEVIWGWDQKHKLANWLSQGHKQFVATGWKVEDASPDIEIMVGVMDFCDIFL